MLKVFRSACFILLQPHEYTKLEPIARLCCFLGYGIEHKGYRCWDPLSKCLRISHHITFWEHKMFSTISSFYVNETPTPLFTNPNISLFPDEIFADDSPSNLTQSTAFPDESSSAVEPTDSSSVPPSPPPCQSSHISQLFVLLRDYVCNSTTVSHEPRTYREASANFLWQKAMVEELQALTSTHTWELVDLPPNKSVVGCKWVYKIKTRTDGPIDWYKARLVERAFHRSMTLIIRRLFPQ